MNLYNSIPFNLLLFALSTAALVLTGGLTAELPFVDMAILTIVAILGTTWLYAFNVFALLKAHRLPALILMIVLACASIYAYSLGLFTMHRISVISFILALGLIYSMPFQINGKTVRIKEMGVAKNLCIGLAWGMLVLFGSDSIHNELALGLATFSFIQITVGSVARDVFDVESDKKLGIHSLPMLINPSPLRWTLRTFNILSFLIPMLLIENRVVWLSMIATATVRALVIEQTNSSQAYFWTQPVNILAPWILFLGLILFYP